MELNASILLLADMVYLQPKHSLGYQLHSIFKQLLYTHIQVDNITWCNPLAFLLPLADSPLLPFYLPLLTWKPSLL